jgi:hypothetical protein
MSVYNGPAVVLASNAAFSCRARLTSGREEVSVGRGQSVPGLSWWRGTLDVEGDAMSAFSAFTGANPLLLRIGEREASFLLDGGTSPRFQITGNGTPPFD